VGFELGGKSFGESLRAGVTRAHERAINVEQDQFHHARTISEPRKPARFLGCLAGNTARTTDFPGSFQLREGGLHEKLEADLKD
jgi:hypothetical protein